MHTVGLLCKMFFKAECTLHWVSPYEIWLLSAIYSQLLNRKKHTFHTILWIPLFWPRGRQAALISEHSGLFRPTAIPDVLFIAHIADAVTPATNEWDAAAGTNSIAPGSIQQFTGLGELGCLRNHCPRVCLLIVTVLELIPLGIVDSGQVSRNVRVQSMMF